jgi:formate hydrogenlyase subunit 3/multisubunit Na+/H+ antiporter MnhD subunit
LEVSEVFCNTLLEPIVVCLIAGAIAYVFSRVAPIISKAAALIGGVWAFASAISTFAHPGGFFFHRWLDLTSWAGFDLPIALRYTGLGGITALGSAFFAVLIIIYSFAVVSRSTWEGRYYSLLIWTLAGATAVAWANHALFLLVAWEWTTLMLYLLLNLGRGDTKTGAAKTFAVLGFADAAMLLGIALLFVVHGEGAMRLESLHLKLQTGTDYLIFLLFLVAALAKAGAIPLSSWIPKAAEHGLTPVIAYLPAAVDKLLGIYLLAQISLNWFATDFAMRNLLMLIGAVTILAAVCMAMVQHELKKLLSFHAVSQVGYMVLGIGTGNPIGIIGGLFHMMNHALYKCNLFLTAGVVEKQTGTTELDDLGGLARVMPVSFVCCLISAAAISGIPPLNGFASKWLVYQGCLQSYDWRATVFLVAAVFGSALTLASFIKVLHSVYWGAPSPAVKQLQGKREPLLACLPMVVLATLCVLFGVWLRGPVGGMLIPSLAEIGIYPAMRVDSEGIALTTGMWNASGATGLLLIGIGLGLVLYLITRATRIRVVRNYICGEVVPAEGVPFDRTATPLDPDRIRLTGPHFYQTMYQLGGIGRLLEDGETGAFDAYRLTGQYGSRLVEMLRSFHTGVIGLYVTWVIAGLAIIAAFLMLGGG